MDYEKRIADSVSEFRGKISDMQFWADKAKDAVEAADEYADNYHELYERYDVLSRGVTYFDRLAGSVDHVRKLRTVSLADIRNGTLSATEQMDILYATVDTLSWLTDNVKGLGDAFKPITESIKTAAVLIKEVEGNISDRQWRNIAGMCCRDLANPNDLIWDNARKRSSELRGLHYLLFRPYSIDRPGTRLYPEDY